MLRKSPCAVPVAAERARLTQGKALHSHHCQSVSSLHNVQMPRKPCCARSPPARKAAWAGPRPHRRHHHTAGEAQLLGTPEACRPGERRCMEIVGCRAEESPCAFRPAAMLFHGISGGHIQGIMEEMERRSKTAESRLAKGVQMNGRDTGLPPMSPEKPALCAGCGGKISDRYYLLAVDKQWHLRCLKCCECKLALESELTCFAKDGSIYCKDDYYRFSVQRCARCHLGISASEMVMRARESVYHLSCFTCTTCNKTLTTGDHFGMKDSLVYCRAHFEALLQGDYHPQLSYTELAAKGGGLAAMPYFNGTGTVQKGRPRKRKSPALGVDIGSYNSGCNENDTDLDRDQSYPPSQKTKRMRTSFKHHQLRTMKSYFAINHNPDAKDLKQLAQKTGLTKRVLQVWFQNARAKFRRNLLRQENGGVDKADGTSLPPPASADSGALSPPPPGTATTLTDLTNPTITVVTPVNSHLDSHESASPSQTTLTNLF
ncbi:LIM/homeobox protein Lhx9 isoform X2 [Ambystoma mexicanum]|uniref:LIM/homeobox protein Lhx9 isoform X2 n=1 Tax=Ambystoma mexicanum TaxID=8296 RepID=UPI0037E9AB01